MVSDIVFRIATSSDAADVAQLVNTAYHGPEAAHGWTPETQLHAGPRPSVAAVTGHILNPDCRLVLCQVSDGLIGCALIERHKDDAHFGMFAVRRRPHSAYPSRNTASDFQNTMLKPPAA